MSIIIIVVTDKTQCARVAQWWSIALPRRGSRVRIPSRAFLLYKNLLCHRADDMYMYFTYRKEITNGEKMG